MWLLALLIAGMFLLAACGPERSSRKGDQLEEETLAIAQTFAQDGDISRARVSLQDLDVANPMQWLVLEAETGVSEQPDAAETRALAELALGLGSQSNLILDYGERVGLIVVSDREADADVASAQEAPRAEVQVEPAALPTLAVIPLEQTEDSAGAGEPANGAAAAEVATPLPVEEPTATAVPVPQAVASAAMNVRSGPGTVYPIVDDMGVGESAAIVAKNAQSDWWQVRLAGDQLGWVFGQLVQTSGDVAAVAVAANIPEPPPPTPTLPPAPEPENPPAEAAPTEGAPVEGEPVEATPPPSDGPDFRVVEKRLWDVYENGGSLSGPTVICGEKHELIVNVVDANGSRINGVTVQSDFNAAESFVTGAQGKGDGVAEFVLWSGQDVKVIRDADGREVTSEVARGMTTRTPEIPFADLIAGQFCTDDESCSKFATPSDQAPGCWGHFSWTVTFQRSY